MARSRTFQVRGNRISHTCMICKNKRSFAIPPDVRTRSIRCHKCGTRERVNLNRRSQPRESQSGRVTIITPQGFQIPSDLSDISPQGVGAVIPLASARRLHVKQLVQFSCSWDRRLLPGRYEIKSIRGNKVGFENKKKI